MQSDLNKEVSLATC